MIYFRNSAPRNYNPYSIHLRPYKPLNYNSCSPKVLLWHTSPTAAACDSTEHVNKKPKNGELLQSTKSQEELVDKNSSTRVVFQDRTTQVVDDKDALIVSVDVPGVSSKDVTIAVEQGVLSIAAERPARAGGNSTTQKQQFFINERKVDTDKLQANLVDGVLTITLPKKEETKPKAIAVAAHGPPEEQITVNKDDDNKDTEASVWQFTYDLPGVKAQDLQLELHNETLTLHATRHNRNGGTSATTIDRKFSVDPTRVDTESITGYLADGVLTLRGTRRPESAPTKVVVVPGSCDNTTVVHSNPSDANQKQNDEYSGESLEQDDMVLVETVPADDDDAK